MITFYDLRARDALMQDATEAALLRVARSGRYILGPEVEAFEAEWAAYVGVPHCVGTGNALDAMQMVLEAWDIGQGLEVIVPSNTYIATWLAVTRAGAVAVPVEPDASYNLDPAKIEAAITERTRAIIAVHLYGHPARMDPINAIAKRHRLKVLEDAAQAHGAEAPDGRRCGALGDAAAWSFYPSKNLGSLGDAGAVTTDDAELAAKVRKLRSYGGGRLLGRIDHELLGMNSRLDEMQAAVLRARLPYLAELNARRVTRAWAYDKELQGCGLVLPPHGGVYHQYVVRTPHRDLLREKLASRGVDAHVHYPVPPHQSQAYTQTMFVGALAVQIQDKLPIAEQYAAEVLSLPIGYEFDTLAVTRAVRASLAEIGAADA